MTKAVFSDPQSAVQSFSVDGNITVVICLNEETKTVEPQSEEESSYTEYLYDFNEFTDLEKNIDLDAIKANPEQYLNYKPAKAPTAEERLAELEQAVQDMALAQMGGDE